jgi:hypothetical protein
MERTVEGVTAGRGRARARDDRDEVSRLIPEIMLIVRDIVCENAGMLYSVGAQFPIVLAASDLRLCQEPGQVPVLPSLQIHKYNVAWYEAHFET